MNPLRYLRPAVYAALAHPAVVLDGLAVPVFAYGVPGPGVPAYVLLPPAQDTVSLTNSGRGGCQSWDCTLLVDAVTLHANGALSVALADALADVVSERLDRVRLPLPAGLQVQRAVVEAVNGGDALDGEQVDVHRYVRLRYSLSYDGARQAPAPGQSPPVPAASVAYSYAFTNLATVTIAHNLGRFVLVEIYSATGQLIDGEVTHVDPNTVTITFSQPLTGTVVLL